MRERALSVNDKAHNVVTAEWRSADTLEPQQTEPKTYFISSRLEGRS